MMGKSNRFQNEKKIKIGHTPARKSVRNALNKLKGKNVKLLRPSSEGI